MSNHPDSSPWRDFLAQTGAVFEKDSVLHFGDPAGERLTAARSDVMVDLSQLALWRVRGNDAESFLQGQLSNDIRLVSERRAQLSAYCSPKGRMFAIFLIFRRGDSYCLQLPTALAEATFKRLRMYVLRAKVAVEPADSDLLKIGISGPSAESLVGPLMNAIPAEPYECGSTDDLTIVRIPGPHPRFEIVAPRTRMMDIWHEFAEQAKPVGSATWSWFDIVAGIPSVLPGTVEAFVPQMTNLELIGGVNFKKGCYPGQEIVARMHYLGHLKQRMVRGNAASDTMPTPGTSVYAPSFPGQAAGHIVDARRSPSSTNGVDLLMVVQVKSIREGNLHLFSEDGPPITIQPLPYPIPMDE